MMLSNCQEKSLSVPMFLSVKDQMYPHREYINGVFKGEIKVLGRSKSKGIDMQMDFILP